MKKDEKQAREGERTPGSDGGTDSLANPVLVLSEEEGPASGKRGPH